VRLGGEGGVVEYPNYDEVINIMIVFLAFQSTKIYQKPNKPDHFLFLLS